MDEPANIFGAPPAPEALALSPGERQGRGMSAKSPVSRPALELLPYQRRWVEDDARLKIVVKARQIGYSFAATLRAVLRCLGRKTTWIFFSKGERQSRLLMEKVQEHVRSCGVVAQACESTFFEGTLIKQLEVRFANGSVIYGLPANPDTARGYSGNVTLDEFAFHADAEKIYAALYPTITRGYCLEVISTPNGQQGKFYELAKAAGLEGQVSGNRAETWHLKAGTWSAHRCDIYEAVRQGLRVDVERLRAGCEDESTWQQEYCCQFISTAENFFPPELLAACLSAEASPDTPPQLLASAPGPGSEFYLGIDIGRHRDRTVFWLDEIQVAGGTSDLKLEISQAASGTGNLDPETSRLSVARLVRSLNNAPFADQLAYARELLSLRTSDGQPLIRRACIDATGMGAPLAEALASEFGPRVEAVLFTSAVKEDLAFRTKRRLEARLSLLPDTREVRTAFSAVKKIVTPSGNLRFDAERTEAGHADEFWAKALADLAADHRPGARLADGFLADGVPLIDPRVFLETTAAARGNLKFEI